MTVRLVGLDVYDPTTGNVRSSSTDDIACWFIDTAYDEESFFVRHAYFIGSDEPYEALRRALTLDGRPHGPSREFLNPVVEGHAERFRVLRRVRTCAVYEALPNR